MCLEQLNMKIIRSDSILKAGNIFFKIGIFILPSTLFLSSIFLFLSMIISNIKNRYLLKDNWNVPLIVCSFLMIIICIISNLNPTNFYNFFLDKKLNWLGLINWIPMFWLYWCAQHYLNNKRDRISCAFFLVLGTIPILISGFGQYYFEWYGPFKLLNGTIVWYQREVKYLTGPFNNPNIAGTWLAVIFPFCFFFVSNSIKINSKKLFYVFLTLATLLASFLTYSRNAIINISIASVILMGVSIKIIFFIFLIILILSASIFIFEIPLDFLNIFKENKFIYSFIPDSNKLLDFLNFSRIKIWRNAIFNIIKSPLIGWGASSFSSIYLLNRYDGERFEHTHNIVLEVAHNYGIIVSLVLFTTIFLLIYKSKPDLSSNKPTENLINKFWWVSTLVMVLMHMSDIAYYDGRISILFWILMAGIRCILKESNLKKIESKSFSN